MWAENVGSRYEVDILIRAKIPVLARNDEEAEDMAFAEADKLCAKFPSEIKGESESVAAMEITEPNVERYHAYDDEEDYT